MTYGKFNFMTKGCILPSPFKANPYLSESSRESSVHYLDLALQFSFQFTYL